MGVRTTSSPAIKNAPEAGLAEGSGSFSNLHLSLLLLGVPWIVKRMLPLVNRGGFWTYCLVCVACGVPVAVAYWTLMSTYGARKNEKVVLPGKGLGAYVELKDAELRRQYGDGEKIPMQVFHDAYFEGKAEFKGTSVYFLNDPGTDAG